MGEFILSYEKYLYDGDDELNEGWKKWLSIFMLLLSLGVVPPAIQAADIQTKIEWAQSVPPEQIALAKFAALLTREEHLDKDDEDDVSELLAKFNAKSKTKITMEDVMKYMNVERYSVGDNHHHYKWTLNVDIGNAKFALNIKNIKPMRYGFGVSLVSDYGDFMSEKVEDSLNKVLLDYEKLTGVEISFLTIPSFYGEDPETFARETFNRWGIGKKGEDNGILIVTGMGDRQYWIKPGYGMEGMFPDAICKRFGEYYLVPNFKEGNYDQGFREMIAAMKKEFGGIPIEMKKELDAKYDKIYRENVKNFFIGLGEYTLLALLLGLIGFLIHYSIKKKRELAEKVKSVKFELSKLDKDIAHLIVDGDTMFNDEEMLAALKEASEALQNSKFKEKNLEHIETRIDELSSELKDIISIELKIKKIKNESAQIFKKLKNYESKPSDMKDVGETVLKTLNELDFGHIDVSEQSLRKYQRIQDRLLTYYRNYENFDKTLAGINISIEGFDKMKKSLLNQLENSRAHRDEVVKMGYETNVKTTEEDIESLKKYIDQMGAIYMVNLKGAANLLDQYEADKRHLSSDMDVPVVKYNDIVSAQKYIKSHEKDINDIIDDIDKHPLSNYIRNSEKVEAGKLADEYEEFKTTTKDVLKISDKLKSVISKLDDIKRLGARRKQDEEDDKRRKREEEDRRRRQEEDDDRRRRNSYSSSHSSGGGGGFSFGGGSSGGGGAGGSW